jgi:hypothetical protein
MKMGCSSKLILMVQGKGLEVKWGLEMEGLEWEWEGLLLEQSEAEWVQA